VTRLKAYTLGVNGFVSRDVLDVLGEPAHRRQATVVIVAGSKLSACDLANAVGIRASHRDPETRMVNGWLIADQLRDFAGDTPGVFVMPLNHAEGDPVVEVHRDGVRVVGTIRELQRLDLGER